MIEDTVNNQRHRYMLYPEVAGYMQKIRDRLRKIIKDLADATELESVPYRLNKAFEEQTKG